MLVLVKKNVPTGKGERGDAQKRTMVSKGGAVGGWRGGQGSKLGNLEQTYFLNVRSLSFQCQ